MHHGGNSPERFRSQKTDCYCWVGILTLPLTSSMSLGKTSFAPPFPHLQNGDNSYLSGMLWGAQESIHAEHLKQCWQVSGSLSCITITTAGTHLPSFSVREATPLAFASPLLSIHPISFPPRLILWAQRTQKPTFFLAVSIHPAEPWREAFSEMKVTTGHWYHQ